MDAKKEEEHNNFGKCSEADNQAGPRSTRSKLPRQAENLSTLVYRCLRGDMIEMFKVISGAYDEQLMPAIVTGEEGFY